MALNAESPGGVRECFEAELVSLRCRLLVRKQLVAVPDDAHDVARIRLDQGFHARSLLAVAGE